MIKYLYCGFDKVSRKSSPPFVADNDFRATLMFRNDLLQLQKQNPERKLEDFELHRVGTFDDDFITEKKPPLQPIGDDDRIDNPKHALYEHCLFADTDKYITITNDYLTSLRSITADTRSEALAKTRTEQQS